MDSSKVTPQSCNIFLNFYWADFYKKCSFASFYIHNGPDKMSDALISLLQWILLRIILRQESCPRRPDRFLSFSPNWNSFLFLGLLERLKEADPVRSEWFRSHLNPEHAARYRTAISRPTARLHTSKRVSGKRAAVWSGRSTSLRMFYWLEQAAPSGAALFKGKAASLALSRLTAREQAAEETDRIRLERRTPSRTGGSDR